MSPPEISDTRSWKGTEGGPQTLSLAELGARDPALDDVMSRPMGMVVFGIAIALWHSQTA